MAALQVLEGANWATVLPRINIDFDDTQTIEWIGDRAEITEFNNAHSDRTIGLRLRLLDDIPGNAPWVDQLFEAHLLDHPDYGRQLIDA